MHALKPVPKKGVATRTPTTLEMKDPAGRRPSWPEYGSALAIAVSWRAGLQVRADKGLES